jgi:hypothetical protein
MLVDVTTGLPAKSVMDNGEPSEADVIGERERIFREGEEARSRLLTRAEKRAPLTRADLSDLAAYCRADAYGFAIAHVKRRCVLKDQLADSTRAVLPKWRGVFTEGRAYEQDSLVAAGHALWISTRGTIDRPGAPSSGWTMIIKGPR